MDVVLFHIGRCGSSVLCNTLNQNKSIQCEGEIFHSYMQLLNKKEKIPPIKNILNSIKKTKKKEIQLVEVKFLKSQHLSLLGYNISELIEIFENYGFDRFIILKRMNYLKRMISHCVAQETNLYHLSAKAKTKLHPISINTNNIKVGVDSYSLIEWFEIFNESYDELNNLLLNKDTLEIFYEIDIEKNITKGYEKICSFLNIIAEPIVINMRKTNPFAVKDILINYNEIFKLISMSKYKWMLE